MTERRSRESAGCDLGCRIRYERRNNEPPSIATATALAQYFGEDVTASSIQLYDYVDPDALDSLFTGTGENRQSVEELTFTVERATVTVRPDHVEVSPTT